MTKPIVRSLLKRTILLADDEPEIVRLLRIVFSREGYKVITAGNGRDVLERIKKGGIDLVILDVVMPVTNGMKVLRKLQKAAPKLPVIIMTGYGDLQSAREAMLLGARDYITKPFDVGFIKATVKQALSKRTAHRVVISRK